MTPRKLAYVSACLLVETKLEDTAPHIHSSLTFNTWSAATSFTT
jgi:hypothetical protein